MIFKYLLTTILLWSSALLAFSQTPSATRVEVRLLAFSPDLELEDVYVQDPASSPTTPAVKVSIRSGLNHEFSVLQLSGRKLILTKKPDRGSMTREGELVAEVTLPDAVRSAILLAIPPAKDSKTLCRLLVINDSKRVFPAGSYHVTNLSPFKVRLVLEDKNFDFNPGQVVLIEKPPFRADHQIGMQAYAFKNNAWLQLASSIWSEPGQRRSVLVLYPDAATGTVQLQTFGDIAPRAEAQETSGQ